MKTRPNLRQLYTELQRIPHYLPTLNSVSPAEAQRIAAKFGESAEDTPQEFAYANECGATVMTRADLNGNGLGMYHNARRMYFSHLYDLHYTAHCEDAEAARHQDYDYAE